MIDIVKILNHATAPVYTSEEYRAIAKETDPYWDAIEKAFSLKFVNDFFLANGAVMEQECSEYFERGLWLGLRLGQLAEQGPRGGVGNF